MKPLDIDGFTVVLFNLLSTYFIIIIFLLYNFKCFDLDFSELWFRLKLIVVLIGSLQSFSCQKFEWVWKKEPEWTLLFFAILPSQKDQLLATSLSLGDSLNYTQINNTLGAHEARGLSLKFHKSSVTDGQQNTPLCSTPDASIAISPHHNVLACNISQSSR